MVEFGFKANAKCKVCDGSIPRLTCRAFYAFHERKFHGYVHVACLHVMEKQFLPGALDALRAVEGLGPSDEIKAKVENAIRSVLKRMD